MRSGFGARFAHARVHVRVDEHVKVHLHVGVHVDVHVNVRMYAFVLRVRPHRVDTTGGLKRWIHKVDYSRTYALKFKT